MIEAKKLNLPPDLDAEVAARLSETCASPIELVLASHLVSSLRGPERFCYTALPWSEFVALPPVIKPTRLTREVTAWLCCQHPINQYRVDLIIGAIISSKPLKGDEEFVMKLFDGTETVLRKSPPIVVECDGHEFHERTKEQAQKDKERDRIISMAGYRVLRFTGSEIWRSPENCALEIFKALLAFTDEVYRG